ncbi:Hypothetical predicted protein [Mytilus galloprovincialis]|uniref:Uncharacterized protein n=1 Tax=Mytilus galloprovincialis TaxID=29158 RepID=A0A8B6F1I1_MYTGA|nr:Hypothetical predicted protein [Mytilus galloprovincialis]
MAAVLGLKLALSVKHALEVPEDNMTFWSDSMNVLCWIRGRSREYRSFVANRIGEIHTSSHPKQWRHVPTQINPYLECTTLKSIHTSDSGWRLDPVRYSSFVRLVVQAYVYRCIDNCRIKQEQRRQGSLCTVEYADAELEIIKSTQREAFSDEYNALINNKDFPKTSKLLGLPPRIDENGLIRCDGRLEYADLLSFDARYPIILQRKNWGGRGEERTIQPI